MKTRILIIHGISATRPNSWWRDFLPKGLTRLPVGVQVDPIRWEAPDQFDEDGFVANMVDYMVDLLSWKKIDLRKQVVDRVLDAMSSGDRVVFISHSMGTVLAMSALASIKVMAWEQKARARPVELFVTVGSPLWIVSPTQSLIRKAVRRLLRKTLGWRHLISEKSSVVRYWANIAGLRDPVAGFAVSSVRGSDRHCITWSKHDIKSYARSWTYRRLWRSILGGQPYSPWPICCWL